MDDDAITACQHFVSTTLASRFDATNPTDDLTIFFGTFFAKHPQNFQFLAGHRALIKSLVIYLKKQNEKDGNLKRFMFTANKKKTKKGHKLLNLVLTSIGNFFVASESGVLRECIDEQKINALFGKITALLQTETHKKMLSKFTTEMISIKMVGIEMWGSVKCVYCHQYKQVYFDESYFVVSNMNRHLNSCAKMYAKNAEVASEINENVKQEESIGSSFASSSQGMVEITDEHEDDTHDSEIPASEPQKNDDSYLISLEINKLNDREQYVNDQIANQLDVMGSVSLENSESQVNMNVEIEKGKSSEIRSALIAADGNCLLGAVAHQLFHYPLGSEQHNNATRSLRENAVKYIKNNIGMFKTSICLRKDFEKVTRGKKKDKKIEFFIEKLLEPGFWGGTEILIAISRLHSANIITIHEGGSCSTTQQFNFDFRLCVILAYCRYKTTSQNDETINNHFNSIITMDSNTILSCVSKIVTSLTPTVIEID